ncbi:MAG: hypothetical protein M3281_05670 [Chloroflexota bacterium]|nr:hypothetical protein [Chloroflexota bacterium]
MKRVLVAHPSGARLYELTDDEYARFEHLLNLERPSHRGAWALRFLAEREPLQVLPPNARGGDQLEALDVDRAVGGNLFTPKWGRRQSGRSNS